jgi:protein phosphatase
MPSIYAYAGKSDTGYNREVNEDYISATTLSDDVLFIAVADGMGSLPSSLQPATIAILEIEQIIKRLFAEDRELFLGNPKLFITEALHTANRVIGAFKMGNEEKYAGFGACITCCLLYKQDEHIKMCFAHAGNTRLFLIRANQQDGAASIKQLTFDHTKAYPLYMDGVISFDQYHTHPDRLIYTSGLGVVAEPIIQVFDGRLKSRDILLLTTDGVHYAVRPEGMSDLVMSSGNCDVAVDGLITASIMQKYIDNMSAMMVIVP